MSAKCGEKKRMFCSRRSQRNCIWKQRCSFPLLGCPCAVPIDGVSMGENGSHKLKRITNRINFYTLKFLQISLNSWQLLDHCVVFINHFSPNAFMISSFKSIKIPTETIRLTHTCEQRKINQPGLERIQKSPSLQCFVKN